MNVETNALGATYERAPLAEELQWQLQGACNGMDPEVFQPHKHDRVTTKAAKRVCLSCPVVLECRNWALTRHEIAGMWGGLTEADRIAIWRSQERPLSGKRYRWI